MKVVFSKAAADELDAVLEYIAERSMEGSRNVRTRIFEKIALIAEQPESGRLVRSRRFRRVVAVPYPYAVYYRVVKDQIQIVGVRHGARRIPKEWR